MHTYVGLRPSRDKEAIHTFSGWKWSENRGTFVLLAFRSPELPL